MPLRREQIVDTAVELLNEGGVDALTTRKLAQRLGVQVGALYWHVGSKREILVEIADRIGAEIDSRTLPAGDWAAQVTDYARATRRALLAHRDGARVIMDALPTPYLEASARRLILLLHSAGISYHQAMLAFDTVMSHVTGFVLQEQSEAKTAEHHERITSALHEMGTTGVDDFEWPQCDPGEQFDAEIEFIVNGLRATLPELSNARQDADRVEPDEPS